MTGVWPRLAAVAKPGGDAADGEMVGEHHVHIGKHAAEKGPGAMHLAQLLEASLARGEPAVDRGAEPVPPGQHEPALAPAEHPWNGAQVLDRFARFARGGAAADVEV